MNELDGSVRLFDQIEEQNYKVRLGIAWLKSVEELRPSLKKSKQPRNGVRRPGKEEKTRA
jgi:hypothetical protein